MPTKCDWTDFVGTLGAGEGAMVGSCEVEGKDGPDFEGAPAGDAEATGDATVEVTNSHRKGVRSCMLSWGQVVAQELKSSTVMSQND